MREFRLLTADEIECRVQSVKSKGAILLLYKTARTDAKILDEKFGMFGWQVRYETIKDNLYCSIGVFCKEMDEWIWKYNCGVESNTEKEKGEASDAFKRAGFTWGIGAELYTTPFIWVSNDVYELDSGGKIAGKFEVAHIGYDEYGNITELVINYLKNSYSEPKEAFTYGKKAKAAISKKKSAKAKPQTPPKAKSDAPAEQKTELAPATPQTWICDVCSEVVKPLRKTDKAGNETIVLPKEIVAESQRRFGACLCSKHLIERIKIEKERENDA